MYLRIVSIWLLLSLVLSSCSIFKSKYKTRGTEGFVNDNAFTDYSSLGEEYAALKNIFLKADSILFLGKDIERINNIELPVSRYRLSVDLRLDTNCSFIDRPDHQHKVYAKKIDFVLSVLEKDVGLLYNFIIDSIFQKYQELNDSIVYDLGVFQYPSKDYVFLNGALTSIDNPFILSSSERALFLRIAKNSSVKDDHLSWVLGFMTYEVIRGIEIRDEPTVIAPTVNDIMGRTKFIDNYNKRKK